MYTSYPILLTLAGATGNVDSKRPYHGQVCAIGVVFTGVPGTTVLTITTKGSNGPALTILVNTATNTSQWYFPQVPTVKSTDGSALAAWFTWPVIDDFVNVAAATSGAGTVQVFLLMKED